MENKLAQRVLENESNYLSGTTQLSKYVDFSLYENVEKIDAYINSRHTSGSTDSLDREKPFFNICTAAINTWYRATDIDRKNIRIKPTKQQDTIAALLATVKLQDWMRKYNFGVFLNEWGRSLARYGSSVVKFVEKEGELHSSVIPWNRLIVDPIDFDSDIVIEVLELTPAQLKKRGYDEEATNELIESTSQRKGIDLNSKDTKDNFIKLYEVHGEMPLSYLTGNDKDEHTYVQQMHVLSFLTKGNDKKEYTLYKGKEEKHPYMITHLIKEDGRTQSIGAVEHLFEAQWMMNHTAKSIKDQLDLASKLIFQTSDANFIGQNALNAIENGDILIHKPNEPLTQINNGSHDITSLQNFATQWKSLGNEITGVSESMLGINPPSGTAWRQTEALLQESHSLFELMTENKGLALEDMLRMYVIPHLKKQLDNKDEIVATLNDNDISKIESLYIKNKAIQLNNDYIKQSILNGQIPEQVDLTQVENGIKEQLNSQTQRFFAPSEIGDKTWKEVFKDLEWEVDVEITGENKDKQATMTTLNTAFATLARLGGREMTPEERLVFNKLLTEAGSLSPIELSQLPKTSVAPTGQPSGGQQVGAEAISVGANKQ